MDRTEATIRKVLSALPAQSYDLGILSERGMYRLEAAPHSRILRMIPYLKHRNVNGAHIYLRPTGESAYTLLDDLTETTLSALTNNGFDPAAVVETSPGNFQAWLRHMQPLSKELGTLAAKTLAAVFGADGSAADWRRFGRAPGFANRKPQHRDKHGRYPFARLHSYTGQLFPAAPEFHGKLLSLLAEQDAQRNALRLSRGGRAFDADRVPVSLARFRDDPRYQDRPAAADMAFAVCALGRGWNEADIAAALIAAYLSRDTNPGRQATYIKRTLAKAIRWTA